MKVLLVTGIYPPDIGGPANFIPKFGAFLKSNGHDPRVLTLADQKKTIIDDDFEVIRIERKGRTVRFARTLRKLVTEYREIEGVLASGLYEESAFALLFCHRRSLARVVGDPIWERARNQGRTTLSIRDFNQSRLSLRFYLQRKLLTWSLNRFDLIVCPSLELMRLIKLWGVKVRINIVQNGVEISGEGKSSEEIGNAITVSRLVPWKRIDRSLRLCSKLNLSLTIVGDGEQRQLLEAEANDLGLRVKFLGQVSGEQVQKLLNRHSIFCLLSEYEGQSFALTEALSKGLFCIVSEAEGNTAIIKHLENGFIFGENDFEKSILELGEILRDSNLVAKIRMQAQRDAVEYYSEEARFLEVKELLEYLE